MTEFSDAAMHFESVKISLRQDKNGMVLQLAIHPDEIPKDILTSFVGTRYMVAMVQIGDDEKPVKGTDKTEGDKAVDSAGALCRNERFRKWLHVRGFANGTTEAHAIEAIRTICGVQSRAEFKQNEAARKEFITLRSEFEADFKKGKVEK